MSIVRSKICGITCVADALMAVEAGAQAIGLVFYAASPRAVEIEQALAIVQALPPFVTSVGLFVDADSHFVERVLETVPLDLLQFHGDEPEAYCTRFNRPYIKAVRVQNAQDILSACERYPTARGLLLDTYVSGVPGGTGLAFDWSLIPQGLNKPIILAGGLDAGNVARAVEQVKPYAVDVSGGVEARKGVKDPAKVRAFLQALHSA